MAGLLDLIDHLSTELKRLDMSSTWTEELESALDRLLDLIDPLDAELLRLKVAGTSVEPLLNARALIHEMRRVISHQDGTGKMVKLERPDEPEDAGEAGDSDEDAETRPG